jgi:DNA-binding MarR family transcriptional regulator
VAPPAGRSASSVRTGPDDDQLGAVRLGLTRLGRLLSSRRVHAGMARAAGVALPEQAMNVLRALGDRDPLPVGDLARAARMDAGAVSRQIRVLEEAGLVERRDSPQHGSIVLVGATTEGRETARRFERVRNAQLSRALADWTDDEREELGRLLLRLVDDLQVTPYQSTDGGA